MIEKLPEIHAEITQRTDKQHAQHRKLHAVMHKVIRIQSIGHTHSTRADRQDKGAVDSKDGCKDLGNGV